MSFSVPGMSSLLSFAPSILGESAYYDDLILDSANRACLTIEDAKNPDGMGGVKKLTLAYNPEALTMSRTVKWSSSETEGNNSQVAFAGGGEDTMDVPVLLDGSEWEVEGGGSILPYIKYLYALSSPYDHGSGGAADIRPAIVSLQMADMLFVGVVTAVKASIEMFNAEGNPMRAVVNVSLKGVFGAESASAGKTLILAPKEKPDKGKGGAKDGGDEIEGKTE